MISTLATYTCASEGITKHAFCDGNGMWESEYIDSCNVSLANPEPDNDPDDFEHKFENTTILLPNTGETFVIGAYLILLLIVNKDFSPIFKMINLCLQKVERVIT